LGLPEALSSGVIDHQAPPLRSASRRRSKLPTLGLFTVVERERGYWSPGGAGPPAPESAGFVLEESQRLSNSLVWRAQRDFYDRRGDQAWLADRIPSYATSNA